MGARRSRDAEGIVYLVGHAHIDLCWLWSRSETIHDICPRTFTSVLNLMDKYPTFHFSQSSAQVYAWMERYYPKIFEEIRRRIKEGRWEVVGGSWVEHNANIISGESLVRQYLYGKRYFMEKFGVDVKVGWLPDSFGFAWSLPQILRKCGIEYFMTHKLKWQVRRMKPPIPFPYHVFWWQSADGSRVLVYHTVRGYNEDVEAMRILSQLEVLKKTHGVDRLMLVYGRGDHGGGPTEDMIERGLALASREGFPEIKFSRAEEYFRDLESLREAGAYPTVNDELYVKTHRGTFTTEGFVKKANRTCEVLLLNAEKFSSLAARFGARYPREELERCWKVLLFGHVHDQIDGTSLDAVYWDAATDYAELIRAGDGLLQRALKTISSRVDTSGSGDRAVIVFNPAAWRRSDVARVGIDPEQADEVLLLDGEGRVVPHQIVEEDEGNMLIFLAEDVPALGYRIYRVESGTVKREAETDLKADGVTIENEFYKVTVDPKTGNLSNLLDKSRNVEMINPERGGNILEVYEDEPPKDAPGGGEPAWNIYLGRKFIPNLVGVQLVEKGPVRAKIRVEKTLGDSKFIQEVILYAGIPRVDFVVRIDWRERHRFAKVAFSLNSSTVSNEYATYEIPYGAIQRFDHTLTEPTGRMSLPPRGWENADRAKFEVPALKWVDVTDRSGEYGVALLNDCKHGFSFEENTIRMSLVRGQRRGYIRSFTGGGIVMLDQWSDQSDKPVVGEHVIRYAIYGHQGGWREGAVARRGYEFNYPLLTVVEPIHGGELPQVHSFVEVSPKNIILTALKVAEDSEDLVLRLYEADNTETEAEVVLDEEPLKVSETDLIEWDKYTEGRTLEVEGRTIKVPMGRSEIKTLKVTFQSKG